MGKQIPSPFHCNSFLSSHLSLIVSVWYGGTENLFPISPAFFPAVDKCFIYQMSTVKELINHLYAPSAYSSSNCWAPHPWNISPQICFFTSSRFSSQSYPELPLTSHLTVNSQSDSLYHFLSVLVFIGLFVCLLLSVYFHLHFLGFHNYLCFLSLPVECKFPWNFLTCHPLRIWTVPGIN